MESSQPTPVSLKIFAGLFILRGIFAAMEMVVLLLHSHLTLQFDVLGLFIGLGLLRFSGGWRTCALVFLWLGLILLPLITLVFIVHPGPLDLKVFGLPVGHAPKALGVAMGAALFILTLWECRVLTRPDIRRRFGLDDGLGKRCEERCLKCILV